jgi:hypothetical protein
MRGCTINNVTEQFARGESTPLEGLYSFSTRAVFQNSKMRGHSTVLYILYIQYTMFNVRAVNTKIVFYRKDDWFTGKI